MAEAINVFQFAVYLHLLLKNQDALWVKSPFLIENCFSFWEDEVFAIDNMTQFQELQIVALIPIWF